MDSKRRTVVETAPWFNREEFEQVQKGIFSDNVFDKVKAVNKISAWESWASPTLPLGACITASLVRALIQKELVKMKLVPSCQVNDIRLMYSTAITRFLNLIAVKFQTYHKCSLRVAARKLKFPVWIVDLRHRATHRKLPSLDSLHEAALYSLEWLKKDYWLPELRNFCDYIPTEMIDINAISVVISTYQNCQYEILVSGVQGKQHDLKVCIQKMEKFVKRDSNAFLRVLLSPGLFLPSTSDLATILIEDEGSFMCENAIELLELPERLWKFWVPVIKMLVIVNRVQELFEMLLECQREVDGVQKKVAAAWCMRLLHLDSMYESELQTISEVQRNSFNWIRLMVSCSKWPSIYTPQLLPQILAKIGPEMPDEKKRIYMAAVAIHLGATVPDDLENHQVEKRKAFTVNDVRKDLVPEPKNSPWKFTDENIDWASIPLGYRFNTKLDVVVPESEGTVIEPSNVAETQPVGNENEETMDIVNEPQVLMTEEHISHDDDDDHIFTYPLDVGGV